MKELTPLICPRCGGTVDRSRMRCEYCGVCGDELLKKPPLGLKPRCIHDDDRECDIRDAINRYIYEKMDIPYEWIAELWELEQRRSERSGYEQER